MTIRKRGTTWQAIVKVKVHGHLHTESRTFSSERLAKDWKERTKAQIKLLGVPQRVKSTKTLGELLQDYKDTVNAIKPMRKQMACEIDQMSDEFRNTKLSQITAKTFSEFGRRRALEGTCGATILHNLSTVCAVLNAAKPVLGVDIDGKEVRASMDALSRLGVTRRSNTRSRRPSDAELDALYTEFRRIAQRPGALIPMEAIVRLAIALPRRLGELTSMRWVDYIPGQQITLFDTKHPTQIRNEVIPVPKEAARIIDAQAKIDARILPYNAESISASFKRACYRLGIRDLRFHDLRHEGITRLFGDGLGIQDVSLISGHKSWAMLKRYTNLTPASVLAKLEIHAQGRNFSAAL